jgi:hypothetical protein
MYYCGNRIFDNVRVTFLCLQNGLPGKTMPLKGIGKVMVLPSSGFNPIIGENYLCCLQIGNGQYVEGDKVFPVAHATPYGDREASPGEVFAHSIESHRRKVAISLAELATGLAGIRDQLPDQTKVMKLVATRHQTRGVMFRPQYRDSDPVVNNQPSMRFFHPIDKREIVSTKEYRVEEVSTVRTGKLNAKGVEIVEVAVRIL